MKRMRTARATKIETLREEERLFVIGCIDRRLSGSKISELYGEKFGKHLASSTIYSYVARRWLPSKIEAEQAVAAAKEFIDLRGAHPEIPEDVLLRGWLRQREASAGFREGMVDPQVVISAELQMRRLDIEERRIRAFEARNELEKRRVVMLEKRLAAARQKLGEVIRDEKASPAEVRRRIREVFGIFDADPGGTATGSAAVQLSRGVDKR